MHAFYETLVYNSDPYLYALSIENHSMLAHWHRDVELIFVCEGNMVVGINKESRRLIEGDMAIIGSTDIHYCNSEGNYSKIIVIVFHPELAGGSSGWPHKLRFVSPFIDKAIWSNLDKDIEYVMKQFFSTIVDEMDKRNNFFELYVKGKISEFWALALRHFETCEKCYDKNILRADSFEKIQNAIEFLENNYDQEISLQNISQKVGFSSYYFSNIFTKYTGMGFKEFLNRLRVNKAEQLIKETNKTIIEISYDCGFNSIRTFNRNFKSIKGYSPSKTKSF